MAKMGKRLVDDWGQQCSFEETGETCQGGSGRPSLKHCDSRSYTNPERRYPSYSVPTFLLLAALVASKISFAAPGANGRARHIGRTNVR